MSFSEHQLLDALRLGETPDWEFKSGKGGVPRSLWETYSAMANTDGGTIVLGVEEKHGVFTPNGLPDPAKAQKSFWDNINNRGKVSVNLLTNQDVVIERVDGAGLLLIKVPRADRWSRPVYVGPNPLVGTYRRFYEGDYKCSRDEVSRMLADQSHESADSQILTHFTLADLDPQSLSQYRNRFASRASDHPWLSESDKDLLTKLGGWRRNRKDGSEGLTVAGLLMFGSDDALRDADALPTFHIDYRERLAEEPGIRWSDRLTRDGTWAGNLFQFYEKVILRLFADVKVPFQMGQELVRKDETVVHEAIREALVNALIHADYRGQGGIVIEKFRDRLELSNPGSLLLSVEQMLRGGVSECRNKALQLMFQQIGRGEKAGSGMNKITTSWASQKWRDPIIQETVKPARVRLVLPMTSLLPDEAVNRLHNILGSGMEDLQAEEIQVLVTALLEGFVSNQRLQQLSESHPTELTKRLQGLCANDYLVKQGYGRWANYRLSMIRFSGLANDASPGANDASSGANDASSGANDASSGANDASSGGSNDASSGANDASSVANDASSVANDASSGANDASSGANDARPTHGDVQKLRAKYCLITQEERVVSYLMDDIILESCGRFVLSRSEIAEILQRKESTVRNIYLPRLLKDGRLVPVHPNPTHPDQRYRTNADQT